ncbi:monocarboxylate transporter 3-like isoform X4 [Mya arenaria]|uniref:monocarboxylate transporter 3-like isoform X4 n=1 Tax=Mya arenaria TaxID=6604 RepID=UPI0022E59BE9|nr:monocarboxylate transporter 3-like isoform X4 [Mya arenaria]
MGVDCDYCMLVLIIDGISFSFGIFYKELLLHFQESKSLTSLIISVLNGTFLGISAGAMGQERYCYENAPDGGWGWVVTFAAFMVGVILDGISYSFGIFYIELLQHFQESKSLTSLIISVLNGTYLGIDPIASILVAVYGYRTVAIFGACLASVSFFLCTFSPNVRIMILVYGLLGGAGLGLVYLPAIVSVGHYFKKKRALATGIAVCGSGIGAFGFAPLSEFLIKKYTWKGAMMIMSAIVLNLVPIAALLRPLEDSRSYSKRMQDSVRNKSSPAKKCCDFDISSTFNFELLKSPTFLVFGMSSFIDTLGSFIPFIYIPDLLNDKAVIVSYQSIILAELLGIEKLTSSFGLLTMCKGISAIIGAPIAGALSDEAGDYKGAFYLAGITIAFSGVISFPLRAINRWEKRREKERNNKINGNEFTSDIEIQITSTSREALRV